MVHRDIKPANILIASSGRVKVADFGIARLLGGSDNLAATVVGTPSYMAPQQARGRRITPATDVYSIGVVLYEMLAGRPPFTGASAVDLALCHLQDPLPPLPPAIPNALGAIVERALAKDPDHRYRNGAEMTVPSPAPGDRFRLRRTQSGCKDLPAQIATVLHAALGRCSTRSQGNSDRALGSPGNDTNRPAAGGRRPCSWPRGCCCWGLSSERS